MVRRNVIIRVRLTPEEYEFICRSAEQSRETRCRNGVKNLSGYIRKCILTESGYAAKINQQRELKNLMYQVRKIGVNINQAAKKINGGYYTAGTGVMLLESMEEINRKMEELKECLEGQDGSNKIDEH